MNVLPLRSQINYPISNAQYIKPKYTKLYYLIKPIQKLTQRESQDINVIS